MNQDNLVEWSKGVQTKPYSIEENTTNWISIRANSYEFCIAFNENFKHCPQWEMLKKSNELFSKFPHQLPRLNLMTAVLLLPGITTVLITINYIIWIGHSIRECKINLNCLKNVNQIKIFWKGMYVM